MPKSPRKARKTHEFPKRAKRARTKRAGPEVPPLQLLQWLDRLRREQQEVAKAAGIGKSYMSHLVSNKKKNPAGGKLFLISNVLGITVNDLYKPPPARGDLERIRQFSSETIKRLLDEPT